jgi:hypothetical protein
MLIFFARLIWEMFMGSGTRSRHVYLPATYMASLRQRAEDEISKGDEKVPFISDGDLITAWGSRVIEASSPSTGTTAIYTIFSVRWRLQNAFNKTSAYMQNTLCPSVVMLSKKDSQEASIGDVALRVRKQLVEQTTDTQVRRLMRIGREWAASMGISPIFARWDSRLVVCTNWSKAKLLQIADFGHAAVNVANEQDKKQDLGKPAFLWSIVVHESPNVPHTFMVYGKDEAGGYWISATLWDVTWRTMERDFGAFKGI